MVAMEAGCQQHGLRQSIPDIANRVQPVFGTFCPIEFVLLCPSSQGFCLPPLGFNAGDEQGGFAAGHVLPDDAASYPPRSGIVRTPAFACFESHCVARPPLPRFRYIWLCAVDSQPSWRDVAGWRQPLCPCGWCHRQPLACRPAARPVWHEPQSAVVFDYQQRPQ